MKILYRQPSQNSGSLSAVGIKDCYYKQLLVEKDRNSITKTHHHTGFELHMVTRGFQEYEAAGCSYNLSQGHFLLIPPKIPHRVIRSDTHTEKTAITFTFSPDPEVSCISLPIPPQISDSLEYIAAEAASCRVYSPLLVENRILEIILFVLRQAGMTEAAAADNIGENTILTLARQYIADNIERNPTVTEVAQYCYLSAKQLTRIFNALEAMSPGEYIIRQRARYIERLLTQNTLTLKQISERMHFSSEYYFNVFFKKYIGMPPGEYRRMHGK